jgi:hypothetical protein
MRLNVEQMVNPANPAAIDASGGMIRIATYIRYPRVSCSQHVRVAHVRDVGDSCLRLNTETPEAIGELLRVNVRDLSGSLSRDTLARVTSCAAGNGRRYEIGLALIESHRPRVVRRPREAISA